MTTHSISDVLHGRIRFRRDKILTGDFLLKKTITVADGDLINIDEDYTGAGNAPTSKTIFHGRINDVDFAKTQYIRAVDVSEELDQIRPTGAYSGYTEVVFGDIINDSKLANVTCTKTESTKYLDPSGDAAVVDCTTAPLFSKINDDTDDTYIKTSTNNAHCEIDFPVNGLSTDYNYIIYRIDVEIRSKYVESGEDASVAQVKIWNGSSWEDLQNATVNTAFDTDTISFTDLQMTQDDVDDLKIYINANMVFGTPELQVSKLRVKIYYRYYPNLAKGTVKGSYYLGGNMSIMHVLKTLNLIELRTWYIDPDLEIHFEGGDVASGKTVAATDKLTHVVGWRQVKSYDKVVLYGKYVGGAQITSTRGDGNIIWRDSYLHIDVQTELDDLADQILAEQGANTVRVQLKRTYPTDGVYQVGETLEVGADVKFSGSDKTIPIAEDATYIINKIDYVISNGVYNYLDIELLDGLLFSTPKDDSLGIVQDMSLENSLGIAQVAGGESVGQANDGTNIGTDGVGVYDSKSGATLQFRNIAPASVKITVTENGDDIDIDVGDIDSVIEGIITEELEAGESIDNRIDTLIGATYTNGEIDDLDDSHQAAAEATAAADATTKADAAQAAAEATAAADTDADITAHHHADSADHDDRYYTETEIDNKNLITQEEAHAYVEATALTLEQDITMDNHDILTVRNIEMADVGEVAGLVDGKDVSTLGTDAEAHAYIEANALTLTQDVTFNAGQLFDGEDVSALADDLDDQCTTAEAITAVEGSVKLDNLQTPDNNTDLDATETEHGLLKLLDGYATNYMDGTGNWSVPVGSYGDGDAVAAIEADDTIYTKNEVDDNTYTRAQVDTEVATKDSKEEAHAYVEVTALILENDLDMGAMGEGANKITGMADPAADQDAATKKYHDDHKYTGAEAHAYVEANALTMTQDITFNAGQTFDGKDVSTLGTDAEAHDYVEANALTMTQDITFNVGQTFDGEDVSALATDLGNQCTTAEAVQAVEDAGLVLSNGQVITSEDADLNFTFGRVGLGGIAGDVAVFSQRDMANAGDYAVKQDNVGNTNINAKTGQKVWFKINNAVKGSIDSSGLLIGSDARITEFDTSPLADSDTKVPTNTTVKEYIDAANAFGIGNKRWITCNYEGGQNVQVASYFRNPGSSNMYLVFGFPLEVIKDGKNLVITDTRIGIKVSDANDYVDRFRLVGIIDHDSENTMIDINHDAVHGTGIGLFTYGHANQTIGGNYERVLFTFNCSNTDAYDLGINFVQVEYYYA